MSASRACLTASFTLLLVAHAASLAGTALLGVLTVGVCFLAVSSFLREDGR